MFPVIRTVLNRDYRRGYYNPYLRTHKEEHPNPKHIEFYVVLLVGIGSRLATSCIGWMMRALIEDWGVWGAEYLGFWVRLLGFIGPRRCLGCRIFRGFW